ncbi:MAG: VWA domain-containing protein [Actinobacteria bacterium]|nr:MAG: VWA domain-containing protein [Actinomycetota bacterium]TMM13074.1 MAG: VWA domain-containing protein [Actinomycetota bacterium]
MASSDGSARPASGRPRAAGRALYGGLPEPGPPGFAPRLLEFADELRGEGLAVGTSELLDAFQVLGELSWSSEEDFREALAATLAKSQEDRRVYELVFDRFFFRAVEREAVERGLREERFGEGDRLPFDLDDLRERIREAVRAGSDGEMRDLARLAIAAFGRQGEGSGVIGVDVQRIRRSLELRGEAAGRDLPDPDSVPQDRLREFERHLRRELERALIERTQSLPPAKPLREFDRALPSGPLQDLAAVHRVVAQLKRRLATRGHQQGGRRRSQAVDVRRTMRASLETGGVPMRLRFRPRRPRRPELYVLCDVSTSVTSASVFFLSVLHALHDSFRKLRSFVFVERISEVTDVFERERSFAAISRAIATDAGVADVSGYTDYGRVWLEFLTEVVDDLDPRSTVIVLGDARTNGREPHAQAFAQVSEHAGRTFWLNPEPRLYWNYGDSVIAAYEPYCDGVFECWTTKQLEVFVNALAGGRGVPAVAR